MSLPDSRHTLLILLTVAGCLSAAVQLPPLDQLKMGGGVEPTNVALRLANDLTLADPYFTVRTGPTTHVSPLFPLYLAGLMKLFGQTALSESFIIIALFVMHTAYPVLLWLAGWRMLGSESAGVAAAMLAIALPTFPLMPQWDYIYTADFLLAMCLAYSGWAAANLTAFQRPALAGLLTGLLSLWNANSIMITLPWFAYVDWRSRGRAPFGWQPPLCFVFAVAAMIAPWVVRNYLVLGSPILLRGNLGLELAVSNNDLAGPTQRQNLQNGAFDVLHPNRNETQAREVARDGEVAYNHRKFAEAWNWMATHPRRFAALTLSRVFYYWFPDSGEYRFYSYRTWLLTLLSFFGVLQLTRRRHPIARFVIPVLVLYPAVFYFVHTSLRLRLPMVWLEVLMAGYALAPLIERIRHRIPWISADLPPAVPASQPTLAE